MWPLSVSLFFAFLSLTRAAPTTDEAADWTTTVWDYIVVGAGPAGIIVADRLSETGKNTLLLEGGGPSYGITGGTLRPSWLQGTSLSRVDVPGLYKSIFDSSTNPQPLLCNNYVNAFGGCTIGGSSAINAGLYFQPPASDFNNYFPTGWKSADLKSAIAKLRARQPGTSTPSQDGKRYLQSGYQAARTWLVNGAGYAETDFNVVPNIKTKVFGHPVYDYNNGQRGGPATTYLQTALKRSNFHMQSGIRVQRVTRQGTTTTGVVATVNGVDKTIKLSSSGRVVLSAGALQSPQLLMFSGIGDPSTLIRLQQAGKLGNLAPSAWLNNTAVGAGLFDNPNTFIELEDTNVAAYGYSYNSPVASDKTLYLSQRSGPYSFASQTSAFWSTLNTSDGRTVGLQGTIDSSGYGAYNDAHSITLNVYGTSGLRSTGQVVLDSNFIPGPSGGLYYNDGTDANSDGSVIATFIHSIFAQLSGSGLVPQNMQASWSVAQIRAYITTPSAYAVGTVNHWSSSCRFGKCVDGYTRVVGMKNLHVVDGSVSAPLTVNPQMGIMVIAERAVERILAL